MSIRNTLDSPEALDNLLVACVRDSKTSTKPLSDTMISRCQFRQPIATSICIIRPKISWQVEWYQAIIPPRPILQTLFELPQEAS